MIDCTIISPQKTTRYKSLQSVAVPGFSGEMQVLAGHAESFVLLNEGSVVLNPGGAEKKFKVPNSECYIKNDSVVIIL